MIDTPTNSPLWQPDAAAQKQTRIHAFIQGLNETGGAQIADYPALYDFSVTESDVFWGAIWDFCEVKASVKGEVILADGDKMPGAQWFPEARLNFAENLLSHRDQQEALVFSGEGLVERRLNRADLYDAVSQLAQALRAMGVVAGDRVAGFVPNTPEAIIAMLATTSIGAIWSSCSPDFGVRGVVDRFGQIEPKVLFSAEGYFYNRKWFSVNDKLAELAIQLPSVQTVVVFPYGDEFNQTSKLGGVVTWAEFIAPHQPVDIEFEQLPFDHPLYVMFSSGTTGVPKCIVHSAGGTLLQHLKEHQLHADVRPADRLFYFTTCGWMMWNWLVSGLASNATLLLFDGSPFAPEPEFLFDFAEKERMTHFGTSAKYIDAVAKAGLEPIKTHNLSALRAMLSTGSPLVPESFDFVYQSIKTDMQLASISGGTDIVSCFVLGCPIVPVWRGEIQTRGLGMAVKVLDDDGQELPAGEKGELCCVKPFPSMPIGFWNDPEGEKYHDAYFAQFDNIWCHGDYVALTEHGGVVIYGRSDAVLNPGGVRIGTAEIYRQVEQLDEVLESLVIGQQWRDDVRVVLFVRLRDGIELDGELKRKIRQQIRANTTPRHVPGRVVQVADIPKTKSGKIVELAVRKVVHGEVVKNKEALANPEALELFKDLPALQS